MNERTNEDKVYCDECIYLENRFVKAEVPLGSGNYIITGKMFYCPVKSRYFAIRTTIKEIALSYCEQGTKAE